MKKDKEALIIFARNSVKGSVKTRLAKDVGEEKAFGIYEKLLETNYSNTKDLKCKKFIFYSDFPGNGFFDKSYEIKIQSEGDLGMRMSKAFDEILGAGFDKVILIGTDCPGLNAEIILKAFKSLEG
ncbi:MAG: DUF2064 domain-containing protein, partial [Bacteroidota bacterium]|nr:DUF2064 domain-containing protein [Bacteroidota bacterium]